MIFYLLILKLKFKDSEGNTPLHLAILNQHASIIEILLRQKEIDLKVRNNIGQSPFATALMRKNNNATSLILKKEPNAAEQVKSILKNKN